MNSQRASAAPPAPRLLAARALSPLVIASALALVGCGGAVTSGAAVGNAGQALVGHAQGAPQGAEVCALQDAFGPPSPTGTEKPVSASCAKQLKSDQLWRRALRVLGSYGASLAHVSTTKSSEGVGQLEAAATGIRGPESIEADEASDKAARDAVVALVKQLGANTAKGDPAKIVNEAAPHVKTICDGLGAYLETQTKGLGEVVKEIEKKRAARTERRCGALDSKTICVSETSVDRAEYAATFSHVVLLEQNHVETYNAVSGFCSAHRKLEEAAAAGKLSKDSTYQEIVEAVRTSKRLTSTAPVPPSESPAPKK